MRCKASDQNINMVTGLRTAARACASRLFIMLHTPRKTAPPTKNDVTPDVIEMRVAATNGSIPLDIKEFQASEASVDEHGGARRGTESYEVLQEVTWQATKIVTRSERTSQARCSRVPYQASDLAWSWHTQTTSP